VISEIRTVYKRALQFSSQEKMLISLHWIAWEKIFGTPMDIENALLFSKRILKTSQKNNNKSQTSSQNSNNHNITVNNNTSFLSKNIKPRNKQSSMTQNSNNSDKESVEENSDTDNENNIFKIPKFNEYSAKKDEEMKYSCDIKKSKTIPFGSLNSSNISKLKTNIFDNSSDFSHKFSTILNLETSNIKSKKARSVLVENIPYNMDNLSLNEIFKQCGEIREIKIFKEDFADKCSAFLEFENKNSVEMALKMDQCITIENKAVSITKLNMKRFIAYLYNINKKTSEKDLKQYFMDNDLSFKEIHLEMRNNVIKYDATVEFHTKDELLKAVNFSRRNVKNKLFKIKMKSKAKSKGFSRNTFSEKKAKDDLMLLNKKRDSKRLSSRSSEKVINPFEKKNSFN